MQILYSGSTEPALVYFPNLFGDTPLRVYNTIQIGSFSITFYGIVIALGMLLAMLYAFKTFRKVGVDPDRAIDAIIGGLIGGVVGARLYFVAFSWDNYGLDFSSGGALWDSIVQIFSIRQGGLAIYGGLIGALLVGLLVAKWRKIHISSLLDVVGVGFLIGQGLGRWGNFFNVEAFGDNTTLPWGMWSEQTSAYLASHQSALQSVGIMVDPSMPVHPCFLYESIWCIVGFFLLSAYMKHRKFDGEVFLMYLAFYGAERSIVEGLRTDSLMIGSLRVSQLLAIVLTIGSIIAIFVIRSRIKGNHDENYGKLFVLTEEGQRIFNGIPEEKPIKKSRKAKKSEATVEKETEIASDKPEQPNFQKEDASNADATSNGEEKEDNGSTDH